MRNLLSITLIIFAHRTSAQLNFYRNPNYGPIPYGSVTNKTNFTRDAAFNIYLQDFQTINTGPAVVSLRDLKSTDDGYNWQETPTVLSGSAPVSIVRTKGNRYTLWSGQGGYTIDRYNEQTHSSTTGAHMPSYLTIFRNLVADSSGVLYLSGETGGGTPGEQVIYKSTDGGSQFTQLSISGLPWFYMGISMAFDSNDRLYIALAGSDPPFLRVFRSLDYGVNWSEVNGVTISSSSYRCAFAFKSSQNYNLICSCTEGYTGYQSSDGLNWSQVTVTGLDGAVKVKSAIYNNSGHILVIGTGEFLYTTDHLVSLNDNGNSISPKVYPNPADKYIYIGDDSSFTGDYMIFDMSGRIIVNGVPSDGMIHVENLTPGIYQLYSRDEKNVARFRFIKQ